MLVIFYMDGEIESHKSCPRTQIGGSKKREELLRACSRRISGRGGIELDRVRWIWSEYVEMVMAFNALSSLFGQVHSLDDWVGLVFELGLLPVPCFMFQRLGTKQHSLNIQIREFRTLCLSREQPLFFIFSLLGALKHPFPPGVISY